MTAMPRATGSWPTDLPRLHSDAPAFARRAVRRLAGRRLVRSASEMFLCIFLLVAPLFAVAMLAP